MQICVPVPTISTYRKHIDRYENDVQFETNVQCFTRKIRKKHSKIKK